MGITAKALGTEVKVHLLGDSSGAKGIILKNGAVPVKHLDIKQLWIQEKIETGEVKALATGAPTPELEEKQTDTCNPEYDGKAIQS